MRKHWSSTVIKYRGEVLEVSIPTAKMKLLPWIELHKDELMADWELAVTGQHPYKIEPLK